MINGCNELLFTGVSEEDYAFLKARQSSIVKESRRDLKYLEGASDKDLAYFDTNKPSFEYNAGRQLLSISLKENRIKRLILSREDFDLMSGIEKKMFFAMRRRLERNIEGIKIRKEDWK